jgi:hypothetical protein
LTKSIFSLTNKSIFFIKNKYILLLEINWNIVNKKEKNWNVFVSIIQLINVFYLCVKNSTYFSRDKILTIRLIVKKRKGKNWKEKEES